MALRMAALSRASDGRWFARKGIPEDVRVEYQRLYGVKREAHLKLPADTPWHEAKTRKAEWEAEVETRIATLRAQRNGKGQPLTKLNAIALAGRWYNWFVKQYENDPGPAKVWRELSDLFVWEVIGPEAPDSYEEDPRSDPHWDWPSAQSTSKRRRLTKGTAKALLSPSERSIGVIAGEAMMVCATILSLPYATSPCRSRTTIRGKCFTISKTECFK